ncbi:MAG: type III pantothenate kinase, partial [Pirellulaceae bacterium]|nr:type III pantothenate kinase [Pirellulaceae bacterium]
MEKACRFLGVDIGNSGLRVAELNIAESKVERTLRITWSHGTAGTRSPAAEVRYAPDSRDWLPIVENFAHETTHAASDTRCVWLVSSVRRDALQVLEEHVVRLIQRRATHDQWRVITRHDIAMQLDVIEPDRVGIDRILAASAAANLFAQRPLIVMQVGSAMTVDLVLEGNVFGGGAILPGVPMMLRLLGQAADLLPTIEADELTDLPPLPGRNTEQAMRCGTASALVGGAQHLVQRYREAHGPATLIVLSGGDGTRLAPHLPQPITIVPHLVLHGLVFIAHKFQS